MAGDAGEDGLFSIDPAQRIGALSGVLKPAVDETFRAFDRLTCRWGPPTCSG